MASIMLQTLAIVLPVLWNENAILNARNCCNMPLASGILPRVLEDVVSMPLSPRRVASSNAWRTDPSFRLRSGR
ncbi:hypothetical protein DMH17_06120 [Raoultella planticola]|nr:hypothetical protein [Raoultella planticola]